MNNSEIMKQVYLLAQEHCGLKIGDYVKITRESTYLEGGWDNTWDCDKQDCIGKIGKIGCFENFGVLVKVQTDKNVTYTMAFPYFILEKIENFKYQFKPFDKVLVRDTNEDKWFPAFYAAYGIATENHIVIGDMLYKQCIPYEGNEHLVGTTDMPNE